jgi:predicted phosphodiesterase
MKYAVIADIHGNLPAFKAVLGDCKKRNVDAYLLLGDYIRDTPFNNEIVNTIRKLPNCIAILGNGDIGVITLDATKPDKCEYDQMYPNFWAYHDLSPQNLEYLKALQHTAEVVLSDGRMIYMSHSIGLIRHNPRLGAFHSGDYAHKMEMSAFSFEDGMREMQLAAESCAEEVADFPGDFCLFGHNHLQFLGNVAGKTFLNPGSCGMPSDYDLRTPYATIDDNGNEIKVELHRVEYDVDETISAIRNFDAFPYASFWGKIRIAILKSGSDIAMSRFWHYAMDVSNNQFPMDNDIWKKVAETFQFEPAWGVEEV